MVFVITGPLKADPALAEKGGQPAHMGRVAPNGDQDFIMCHIGTKRKLRKVSTKSFIQRMIGVRIADSAIQILHHV